MGVGIVPLWMHGTSIVFTISLCSLDMTENADRCLETTSSLVRMCNGDSDVGPKDLSKPPKPEMEVISTSLEAISTRMRNVYILRTVSHSHGYPATHGSMPPFY